MRAGLLALLLSGCQSQKDFDLEDNESYCGPITSADFLRRPNGNEPNAFYEDDRIELHGYSSRQAACPAGSLTTTSRLLDGAELRPIEVLAHDPLSTLQFGDGRVENEIYFVRTARGQDLLAVLSLMTDGAVELRLLGAAQSEEGGGLPPCPTDPDAGVAALPPTPVFALFHLRRDRAGCL
jgi:hypothetical protein